MSMITIPKSELDALEARVQEKDARIKSLEDVVAYLEREYRALAATRIFSTLQLYHTYELNFAMMRRVLTLVPGEPARRSCQLQQLDRDIENNRVLLAKADATWETFCANNSDLKAVIEPLQSIKFPDIRSLVPTGDQNA